MSDQTPTAADASTTAAPATPPAADPPATPATSSAPASDATNASPSVQASTSDSSAPSTPDASTPAPSSGPRLEWGPDLDSEYSADHGESPNGKPDVELSFIKHNSTTGEVYLDLPAHNPAEHNAPERVYLICYPPGAAVHSDPADALASGQPQSFVDVPPSPDGAEIVLPRPTGVKKRVKHRAKTILQFAS